MWESLKTDWVCLDCELMPWSAKAQELLRQQYATTGTAARAALPAAIAALSQAQQIPEAAALLESYKQRGETAERYVDAYRQYCWTVNSLPDLKLAPFHLLASEGAVHTSKDHFGSHPHKSERVLTRNPSPSANVGQDEGFNNFRAAASEAWSGANASILSNVSDILPHSRAVLQLCQILGR
jgi:hypothetical protein